MAIAAECEIRIDSLPDNKHTKTLEIRYREVRLVFKLGTLSTKVELLYSTKCRKDKKHYQNWHNE